MGVAQIGVAKRAADRISVKLEAAKRSGKAIDMEEEFRLLTLQVIGEAVLSLPPEECDRVGVTIAGCHHNHLYHLHQFPHTPTAKCLHPDHCLTTDGANKAGHAILMEASSHFWHAGSNY